MRRRPERNRKMAKSPGRKAGPKKRRGVSNSARRRSSGVVSETELAKSIRERNEAQEQQAATAEVLKVISRSTFDLQRVLNTLTKWAVKLCVADGGIISMQDGDLYQVRAVHGFSGGGKRYLLEHPLLPRNSGGVTGRVALGGKAVHIPDVLADAEYTSMGYQRALRQRTNLGVPLLRNGTVIGVFSLTRTEVAPFTDKQIELVSTFADQAVIAIENTRLVNELRDSERHLREERERLIEAAKQQTATSEMLRTISNSRIQSVLDAVAKNAANLCDADNTRIWRLDGNMLRMAATYGQDSVPDYTREGLPVNRDTVIGRAACERRTIHVQDLAAEDGEYPLGSRLIEKEGYRTTLATPLLRDGVPIGVVMAARVEARPFDERQIALVENFADQAVIAIENVRLFEAEKQRAQALRRSEAYLAEAQRLTHTGAYGLAAVTPGEDSRGDEAFPRRIVYWSDENYRIWGFDPRQGLPSYEALWQRVHPDDRDAAAEEMLEALRQKRDYAIDARIVLPDGTIKYLEATGHHLFSAGGDLVEVVGTHVDVTERKRAEEALQSSEAKFRDFAETASDWVWEIGPDYKFTSLSENAFGSDSENRIGKACWDHALDVETEPEKWRSVRATLDSRKPFRDLVYLAADGDGSPIYVKANGKPMFDVGGEFCGYRGTSTDVTATIRAQQAEESLRTVQAELTRVSRVTALGQLTASITHEVTQPIASSRNNARAALNFLDRQPPNLSEIKEALECVVADADRAGQIVDRIRDHIKKAPPRKECFDLNEAVSEVLLLARSAITESEITVRTRFAEGALAAYGDRVQVQQVVLNLVLNAVEAMMSVKAQTRLLRISTEQNRANEVLVGIRDSGPGIEPDRLDRVFEAFYTTKSNGVGMGLAICRSIINAQGGRLWAETKKQRGAVFRFTLPNAENS
jgi:PAS domain S-box-containing protein